MTQGKEKAQPRGSRLEIQTVSLPLLAILLCRLRRRLLCSGFLGGLRSRLGCLLSRSLGRSSFLSGSRSLHWRLRRSFGRSFRRRLGWSRRSSFRDAFRRSCSRRLRDFSSALRRLCALDCRRCGSYCRHWLRGFRSLLYGLGGLPRPRRVGAGGGGGGGGGESGSRNFTVSVCERSLPSSISRNTSCAIFGYSGSCGVMCSSAISGNGKRSADLTPLAEEILDLLRHGLLLAGHSQEQNPSGVRFGQAASTCRNLCSLPYRSAALKSSLAASSRCFHELTKFFMRNHLLDIADVFVGEPRGQKVHDRRSRIGAVFQAHHFCESWSTVPDRSIHLRGRQCG